MPLHGGDGMVFGDCARDVTPDWHRSSVLLLSKLHPDPANMLQGTAEEELIEVTAAAVRAWTAPRAQAPRGSGSAPGVAQPASHPNPNPEATGSGGTLEAARAAERRSLRNRILSRVRRVDVAALPGSRAGEQVLRGGMPGVGVRLGLGGQAKDALVRPGECASPCGARPAGLEEVGAAHPRPAVQSAAVARPVAAPGVDSGSALGVLPAARMPSALQVAVVAGPGAGPGFGVDVGGSAPSAGSRPQGGAEDAQGCTAGHATGGWEHPREKPCDGGAASAVGRGAVSGKFTLLCSPPGVVSGSSLEGLDAAPAGASVARAQPCCASKVGLGTLAQ